MKLAGETRVVVVLLVMVLSFGSAIYKAIKRVQREESIRKWAKKKGWKYTYSDRSFDKNYSFPCLHRGDRHGAVHVVTGVFQNRTFRAFDYSYRSQKDAGTFSAVMVDAGLPMKSLIIRAEKFTDQISDFTRMDDINFESAEFSRRFFVKSADRRWAYDVLNPKAMEYLLEAPDFIIEFNDMQVIAYRETKLSIQEFERAIETINRLLKFLPDSLIQELKREVA